MVVRPLVSHPIPAVYDVCAMGNAIVDVIADCEDSFLGAYGITKGAMTLIDEERADFLYKHIGPAIEMSGGSAANTAAGVASLGGMPTYIGKVKDDQLGNIFRHDMRASGVHFPTAPAVSGAATARCLILVTPDAQRSMNTYLGACVDLTAADVDATLVANAAVTYLEGYLFDKPTAQEAFYAAAQMAHKAGRRVALTLSDTFCVDRHRAAFARFVREEVDCLIGNEYELMSLYQVPTIEEAMAAARAQCGVVVGTRSEKGAVVASGDEIYAVEALKVPAVVDSTGAGDLFAAGFLYGMTHGLNLEGCARLGAVAAGEVIGHYGPRPQRNLRDFAKENGVAV